VSGPVTTTTDARSRTVPAPELGLEVLGRRVIADGVVLLTLGLPSGEPLPSWEPGAHLDLVLGSGDVRQYSLCGDPTDEDEWQIAVRLADEGRGGSLSVHRDLHEGADVTVRGPRNSFVLVDAPSYLFLAGGIGITPILPMVRAATARGREVTLVYVGRSLESMPFARELAEELGGRVRLAATDAGDGPDLEEVLRGTRTDTSVYCCGPPRFTDAVLDATSGWPAGRVRVERFLPLAPEPDVQDRPFEVECALSGVVVHVGAEQTVLDALEGAGVFVNSSCREGTCGSCETTIVAGTAEHRDALLTDEERAGNETMMVCVSRSAGPRITLDL